jgi:hypothetical protein
VVSPPTLKTFKKKYEGHYDSLIYKFVMDSKPIVEKLQGLIKQLEDTARVRGAAGYEATGTPKKQPSRKRAATSMATQVAE